MSAITVTAEHIAKGRRDDCLKCPVALAILEAFPDALPEVSAETVMLVGDGQRVEIDLPASVGEFVVAFDDRWPVEPFTFTLDYPAVTS